MLKVASAVESGGTDQDRVLVLPIEDGLLLAVCDGAGGWGDGARAAELVIDGLRSLGDRAQPQWDRILRELDRELAQANLGEAAVTVVQASERQLRGASLGDCAAFVLGGGRLDEVTRDQHRKPLLGSGEARVVAFERASWQGRVLLASDGIAKYVPRDDLAALAGAGSVSEAIAALAKRARLPSGVLPDDLALVLCEKSAD
jgi:serine/threonine protein phosphatase PrpC